MAFEPRSFRSKSAGVALATSGARSARDWRYITNDDHATVAAAGYFNNHRAHVGVGDYVYASVDLDGTPQARIYMFNSVPASGNVTVVQVNNS
ncbi:hypothetical protein GGQ86_000369 [Xanthobacter flavus]|uniref:Uncharacterized protein n=1 Tax=Xanthobacter flavus TaxID=281 RepID=A0A9W6CUL4_XANFL|nr:hypothetical protein [Xanthobacter flavus]MDR6331922.1 hypothetical protein [Xanthobacter flavus]GLI25644.1 hypothetical protein XFLAVUS301_53180 [Xanthobacter flavus]